MAERTGRQLIEDLKRTRPDVAITVTREPDPYPHWDGDGPDPAEEGCVCYDWTVTAYTIRKGRLLQGENALGGSWYHPDDKGEAYLEVSGYLPQMVEEALSELEAALSEVE